MKKDEIEADYERVCSHRGGLTSNTDLYKGKESRVMLESM